MVDFQSRYKIYSYGYISPTSRPGVPTLKQIKHEANRQIAGPYSDRPVHDCRLESMKEYVEPNDWETQLLFSGVKQIYNDVHKLHSKPKEDPPCPKRQPDKLLCKVGCQGSSEGDFKYPRDVITTQNGDIIVADTNNHRVQIFNQFGVYRYQIGKKGKRFGEFNQPTGIATYAKNHLVVADSKNKRIQILTFDGKFKSAFTTKSQPYSLATDGFKNIIVACQNGTVNIYDRNYQLVKYFPLQGLKDKHTFVKICAEGDEQVYVCNSTQSLIQCYSYDGQLLQQFQPKSADDRLAVVPSDICFDSIGQLVISDSLNHTVNVYTQDGVMIRQVLRPTDEIGAVFSFCIGPEGHLVATELSISGNHCLKMFRYTPCECHENRPSSSKRRTPVT